MIDAIYVIFGILLHVICIGGIYALGASSLTIVYGGLRFPNITVGGFLLLAAVTLHQLVNVLNFNLFIAMALTLMLFALLYFIFDRILFRKYYQAIQDPSINYLLISIGFINIIAALFESLIPSDTRILDIPYKNITYYLGALKVNVATFLALILEYSLIFIFTLFMRYSRQGRALRALVQDKEAASLMGVDVVKLSSLAYILSSLLATAAGLIYPLMYSFEPSLLSLGYMFLSIVVVGGPGSVIGCVIVGLIYGFIDSIISFFFSPYMSIYAFYGVLFMLLLLKPEGLFTR